MPGDFPPLALFNELWDLWNEDERSQFVAHFLMCAVETIEYEGGFVCIPIESNLISD